MKKAYVRTEIIKFLNAMELADGEPITIDDIMNSLPEIYKKLKEDPENPIGDMNYNTFRFGVQAGFQIGQQRAMRGI